MDRENFITSLRTNLLAMVEDYLTPVAIKYGYSEAPLETNIKWRPQVLVLGNYSSGKSTLINDFLGADIQDTGQAPTDDSFTVITYDGTASSEGTIRVTEERDGKFLLNDPEYPFESLKKHGQRFASHFRLKKVNSPFLKNLAVIDTPGMLDSITERDRGYNYQEVIGDFAQIADLVLVLFDPHKAGTVREAHTSLRETLPTRTFEDRVLFVLNRIDECVSLTDLLHVYGTLCWNLSQMTGRKDIPTIHLTYSAGAVDLVINGKERDISFLKLLENQREALKKAILEAPRHRLDHLATFVETHGERLAHLLEALVSYGAQFRRFKVRFTMTGFVSCAIAAALGLLALGAAQVLPLGDPIVMYGVGGGAFLVLLVVWMTALKKMFYRRFRKKRMKHLDELTPLENQTRRDTWASIRANVAKFLDKTAGFFPLRELRSQYDSVNRVCKSGAREIREALNELASLDQDDTVEMDKWVASQSKLIRKAAEKS
ncbi:MAG: dynamin family protein [Deltaproteobacteria bacterium]|nr:dynamin family protein [Deltaproteobacteria bacterium]